jgi:hypothetical protein
MCCCRRALLLLQLLPCEPLQYLCLQVAAMAYVSGRACCAQAAAAQSVDALAHRACMLPASMSAAGLRSGSSSVGGCEGH